MPYCYREHVHLICLAPNQSCTKPVCQLLDSHGAARHAAHNGYGVLQVTYRCSVPCTECVSRQLSPALSLTTPARNVLSSCCSLLQAKHEFPLASSSAIGLRHYCANACLTSTDAFAVVCQAPAEHCLPKLNLTLTQTSTVYARAIKPWAVSSSPC